MKYDGDLIISAQDIAKEVTILLALATQKDDIYDKLETSSKLFQPLLEGYHFYKLEDVYWDITVEIVASKLIHIAVIVRNLYYHVKKRDNFTETISSQTDSIKKFIDFCSKIVHLTEFHFDEDNFIIKIEGAKNSHKYNIYAFCNEAVMFSTFAEHLIYNDYS